MFRTLSLWLVLTCTVPTLAGATTTLSLRAAERLALEQNLGLRAGSLELRASAAAAWGAYGLYDLETVADISHGESRDLINAPGTPLRSETRFTLWDLGLRQLLPSGGALGLTFDNTRSQDLDGTGNSYDPAFASELRLSLSQPLLRDFGRTATEEPIILATYSRDAAGESLRLSAQTLLVQVRNLYGDILQARDLVDAARLSRDLAEQILAESRARVAAGVLPPIDILDAEFGLLQRERDLLNATQNERDLFDRLVVLLALPGEPDFELEPLPQTELTTDEAADVAAALELRPDLAQQRQELALLDVRERLARQRQLPALDLNASYGRRGLGGDYGKDLDTLASEDLDNWQVGLAFRYPLGNRLAEGTALQLKLQRDAARSRLLQQHEEVRREVRTAIRQLDIGRQRLAVTEKGLQLAEERLRSLIKRREVGLATTRDVLEGETDRNRAHADHTAARTGYAQAVTDYLRATGRLLDHEGIRIAAADPDRDRPLFVLPADQP